MKIEVTEEQAGLLKALLHERVFLAVRKPTDQVSMDARYVADKLGPVYEQVRHVQMQPLW